MRRSFSLLLLSRSVLSLALAACSPRLPAAPAPPADDAVLGPSQRTAEPAGLASDDAAPYALLPGDVVSIRIMSLDTIETTGLVVDETGTVHIPLVGPVAVGDLGIGAAQALVETRVRSLDRHARVILSVTDAAGHHALVTGAVEHPGVVPVRAGMRVAEALLLGGGPKMRDMEGRPFELADMDAARVVRDGKPLPVSLARAMRGDPRHNVRLRAGDVLFVPPSRGREVVVLGDVRAPKSIPYFEGIRLTTAVAIAGGTAKTADESDVRLVRGPLSAPRVYTTSLRALVRGEGRDVALEPGDVVFVSEHWFATATDVVARLTPLLLGAAFVTSQK